MTSAFSSVCQRRSSGTADAPTRTVSDRKAHDTRPRQNGSVIARKMLRMEQATCQSSLTLIQFTFRSTVVVMASFDLIVLGGGPAGYTGAIRAAQLGLNTAIIDKGEVVGGTCLNIGCIPSKALLLSSDHLHFAQHQAARHGLKFENISFDLTRMMNRKLGVVRQLTQGLEFLMKKNKITRLFGVGQVVAPGKVDLKKKDGSEEEFEGKQIVLATGSVPAELPNVAIDRQTIVTSEEALSFDRVPSELVVIGAGSIGLELGSVWSRLGSKVTI